MTISELLEHFNKETYAVVIRRDPGYNQLPVVYIGKVKEVPEMYHPKEALWWEVARHGGITFEIA